MNGDVVHRLGTAVAAVAALGWGVRLVLEVRRARRARHRAVELLAPEPVAPGRRLPVTDTARRWLPPVGAAGDRKSVV